MRGFLDYRRSKSTAEERLETRKGFFVGNLNIKKSRIHGLIIPILFIGLGLTMTSLTPPYVVYGHHNYQCRPTPHYPEACGYLGNTAPTVSSALIYVPPNPHKVILNGSDPDKNDTLTFYLTQKPLNGYLTHITKNSVDYTANPGFQGLDQFTYIAKDTGDGLNSTNTGTVLINATVPVEEKENPPTVPPNSTINLIINATKPLKIKLNGSDLDDNLTFYMVQKPSNGHLGNFSGRVGNVSGTWVTYTPDNTTKFKGDKFIYRAKDSDANVYSNNGTVLINATAPTHPVKKDNPPTVSSFQLSINGSKPFKVQLRGSDRDPNDTLTYSIVQQPLNGRVGNVTGSYVNYTPNAGFSGLDSFAYHAKDRDAGLYSNNGNVTITTRLPPAPQTIPGISVDTIIIYVIIITVAMIAPILYDMRLWSIGKSAFTDFRSYPGLGRQLMMFAIIILLAILVFHVITILSLSINSTLPSVIESNKSLISLVTSIGTILGGAVSSIIGFYFGSKATSHGIALAKAPSNGAVTTAKTPPGPTEPSTFPSDGSNPVPVDTAIKATFSEPVSIEPNSLTIKDVNNKPVDGKTSLSGDGKTVVFKPEKLASSTTYVATIAGVRDLKGNAMTKPKTWKFTTVE